MTTVSPLGVRHRLEYLGEGSLHLGLPLVPLTVHLISARGLEHTVLCEKTHQVSKVVTVPRLGVPMEKCQELLLGSPVAHALEAITHFGALLPPPGTVGT